MEDRHSGRDSRQAILPDALRVNANLFQTDLCRNPDYMDVFKLAIHGTGYPLPGEYDKLLDHLYISIYPCASKNQAITQFLLIENILKHHRNQSNKQNL